MNEGRFLRQVYNTDFNFIETIDPLEQVFLKISTGPIEHTSNHSHMELLQDSLLSELAAQTPLMVHNQSPRNMYQCQMAK
jgi:DNA-directed RNA polymerase I subunit RPA2